MLLNIASKLIWASIMAVDDFFEILSSGCLKIFLNVFYYFALIVSKLLSKWYAGKIHDSPL